MENQLKTYYISVEFSTNTDPHKWFLEAIQENLDETGEEIHFVRCEETTGLKEHTLNN